MPKSQIMSNELKESASSEMSRSHISSEMKKFMMTSIINVCMPCKGTVRVRDGNGKI